MSDSMFRNQVSQGKQAAERIPKFIGIIYQMIEDPRYQDYVSWSNDGCAMLIKKPTEFAEQVLPIFFKHNNFSSFVRQLNLYSFRKKKHYPFDNAFVHGMFKRGQKGLLKYIKRKGNDKYPLSPQDPEKVPFYGGQEEETSYEELIRQNSFLKKVHQDLSEHVQNVEKRIVDLTHQNKYLQSKYDKKKQEEDLLKKVVKQLSAVYGEETVKTVFTSVMHEVKDGRENRRHMPDEYDLNMKTLTDKLTKHTQVQESLIISSAKDDHKLIDDFFEEKLETDNSTPTNEKSPLEDFADGLTPKRVNTNFSNWSFHKTANQKRQFVSNSPAFQEIYFDGNFNLFE